MSWCLTLGSGPDSRRLHLGEGCTQTYTGAIISAGHHFRTWSCESVNRGTTKLYAHFIRDLTSVSPENSFLSFWSPSQHKEIFKKASRYKRPSKLKLYRMQWAHSTTIESDFFFFSSSHSHLSSTFENRNPCVNTSSWSSPPRGGRGGENVKTKKECIGMSGIVMAETQLRGI